jgi:hypothetical protein
VNVLDEPADSSDIQRLQQRIRSSKAVRRLLSHRRSDGTIPADPYKKWQGPHWTLVFLAELEYPAGDESLLPMKEQFYNYVFAKEHLQSPRTLTIPGQEDRVRRCTSQEANAIWYALKLGLDDERTDRLVKRLKRLQWPDGGWNCDTRPEARISSFHETILPIRALSLYGRMKEDPESLEVARQAAEVLLCRKLFRRQRDGQVISPDFLMLQFPHFFIYNILLGLKVMAEAGFVRDERCKEALDILEAKQHPEGGFSLEKRNYRTTGEIETRGTFADWGAVGKRQWNEFVTVDALHILKAAGRLASGQVGQ